MTRGQLTCSCCAWIPMAPEQKCKLCGRTAQRCDMCGQMCRNPLETILTVFCKDCQEKESTNDQGT